MRNRMPMESTSTPNLPAINPNENLDFTWGVKIPLRDGLRLNATLYQPKDSPPVPAIFTLTPYIADTYHARAVYFAQHGYAFLLVDCRGRGNSQGEFDPFKDGRRTPSISSTGWQSSPGATAR